MCVCFRQTYISVFLCSDELNHSPTMQRKEKKKEDGHNMFCYCCTCWELNGEGNVKTAMGVECAGWNRRMCVCNCVSDYNLRSTSH